MSITTWLEADVVVDLANLSYWVAGVQRLEGTVWPALPLVAHALAQYGVRTRSFVVAMPTRAFVGIGRSERDLRNPAQAGKAATDAAQRHARENIGSGIAWVQQQRRVLADTSIMGNDASESPIDIRIADGGTLGFGERGVDELAALAALDLLWSLPDTEGETGRGVILISRDRDVEVCHQIASGRPLFGLGVANADGRRRAEELDRRYGYRYLLMPNRVLGRLGLAEADALGRPNEYRERLLAARADIDAELGGLAAQDISESGRPAGRLTLSPSPGEPPRPVSSPLPTTQSPSTVAPPGSWEARRVAATDGRPTVCIADPVGLQRTGARAYGLAGLPGPDTLARLIEGRLQYPGPMGLLCTVSDATGRSFSSLESWVAEHAADFRSPARRYVEAVRATDADYDELAERIAEHGAVDRATLDLHLRPRREDRPAARHLRIEEKEVTVLLAADLLWTLLHTSAHIILATDRAVLQFVLENLPSAVADPERSERLRHDIGARVTRVGIHADPYLTEAYVGPGETPIPPRTAPLPSGQAHIVVLDGALAAETLGLENRLHGPALEATIHGLLERGDVVWQVVEATSGDPWDAGLRLSAVTADSSDEPDLEVWLDRGLLVSDELYDQLVQGVRSEDVPLASRFDRTRPCATARLQLGKGGGDTLAQAIVITPADGGATIDLDGDERTTEDRVVVPVGHGFTTLRPGMSVVVLWDPVHRRVLRLIGPVGQLTDGADDGLDGLPVVGELVDARAAVVPARSDQGVVLTLHSAPSARWAESTPGSRVLVVPTGSNDGYVMSTALPHLQDPMSTSARTETP